MVLCECVHVNVRVYVSVCVISFLQIFFKLCHHWVEKITFLSTYCLRVWRTLSDLFYTYITCQIAVIQRLLLEGAIPLSPLPTHICLNFCNPFVYSQLYDCAWRYGNCELRSHYQFPLSELWYHEVIIRLPRI